jgi:predicted nucleic acid-binding protein
VSFVDTNVLVYATATSAPFRDRARAALVRLAADEQLSVSRQILREYVAVMTRPQTWGRALSLAESMRSSMPPWRRWGQRPMAPSLTLPRRRSQAGEGRVGDRGQGAAGVLAEIPVG